MNRESPTPIEAAKLDKVSSWLIRRKAQVAASVLRMGRVRFTDVVDTAAVRVTGSEIDLFFQREFFAKLKLVELTAVLLHEALHVVFKHQSRAERISNNWDRRLFTYSCEAVVNDTIIRYFPETDLPGDAVTGMELIGQDTSSMTAEKVMSILRRQLKPNDERCLAGCLDDHDLWDPAVGAGCDNDQGDPISGSGRSTSTRWDESSDQIIEELKKQNPKCKLWGSKALGAPRLAPRHRNRTDLRRFLTEQLRPASRYETIWSKPNRKGMAIYPEVILPTYEPENWMVRVLMAIDASGSVSSQFLGVARAVANQQLPGTRIRIISFDTETYEAELGATTLMGGGGTDAGAVERFIQEEMSTYPDYVFIFTDGYTPPPKPKYPERWIWLLPPEGSDEAIASVSQKYVFDPREV